MRAVAIVLATERWFALVGYLTSSRNQEITELAYVKIAAS